MIAIMPRRRYRLFAVCAVVMVFMLYRVAQNTWDQPMGYGSSLRPAPIPHAARPLDAELAETLRKEPTMPQVPMDEEGWREPAEDGGRGGNGKTTAGEEGTRTKTEEKGAEVPGSNGQDAYDDEEEESSSSSETAEDAASSSDAALAEDTDESSSAEEPGETVVQEKSPPKANQNHNKLLPEGFEQVHWTKPKERFPLPEESVIALPVGTPKKIAKIQYDFPPESKDARATRLQRQKRVKVELERAWGGYRKYAWMHDELSPVSNKYRDPFCGWAATLVDSLDTLWIAGMKEEFDEAARAVGQIDFTFTPRNDIPVFETTIRYLGGLLAAFDVSGGHDGKYLVLLEKATELAEILMGIFDTPNRMPVLYYKWRPEYTSQPHRAGIVSIAELGTLSMEFTRLAQLTGKQKYYDGVDRITNALVDMQEAGTTIPGLFPEQIDASGCNKTAKTLKQTLSKQAQAQMDSPELQHEPEGYRPGAAAQAHAVGAQKQKENEKERAAAALEKAAKAAKPASKDKDKDKDKDESKNHEDNPDERLDDRLSRRDTATTDLMSEAGVGTETETAAEAETEVTTLSKNQVPKAPDYLSDPPSPFAADGSSAEWDCEPQGLVSGSHGYNSYHMGGSQDSAYEYFPKQYLLLGGLEPKYQKLYEDTINAINEWLLFRPMIKDQGWDVLFPAKVNTNGNPETDLIPIFETTHLTCFIGGMYGLGGKIFGREEDIEMAKKLTDGCVWAYQSTPSGVMPESAHVVPCPTLDACEFNETLWWEHLDMSKEWRKKEMQKWEAAEQEMRKWEAAEQERIEAEEAAAVEEAAKQRVEQDSHVLDIKAESPPAMPPPTEAKEGDTEPAEKAKTQRPKAREQQEAKAAQEADEVATQRVEQNSHVLDIKAEARPAAFPPTAAEANTGSQVVKRGVSTQVEDEQPADAEDDDGSVLPGSVQKGAGPSAQDLGSKDKDSIGSKSEEKSALADSRSPGQKPPGKPDPPQVPWPPPRLMSKPQTHEEFVQKKIEAQRLPPGYTNIGSSSYILRPEAIESVWYMYRITGDPSWMDKGWRMFEAVVTATRTEFANSAIDSVFVDSPIVKDQMESFWIAETLKYFYLLFSEPDVISLDDWVLNTEAHPFRRPK